LLSGIEIAVGFRRSSTLKGILNFGSNLRRKRLLQSMTQSLSCSKLTEAA
jgi:hypothetical protein